MHARDSSERVRDLRGDEAGACDCPTGGIRPTLVERPPAAPRCREDALPTELRTLDRPGAVRLKPAPPERESHAQSNEQDAGQAGLTNVVLELRQIAAEHVAEGGNEHGPAHGAECVIEHKGPIRHMGHSRYVASSGG